MKRLSANILSMAASDVLRRLFGFASVAYLARVLSVDGFGAVGIAATVLSYAVTIGSAGLHTYGTREIARGESDAILRQIVPARLMNALLLTAVTWGITWWFVPERTVALLISITTTASIVHSSFLEWYYQGKERMGLIGVSWTFSAAAYLAILVAFVKSDANLLMVGVAAVGGDLVCAAILWQRFIRDGGSVSFRCSIADWRATLSKALPMGLGTIIATVTTNLPVLIIGIVLSNADAGYYTAAFKIVFFLLMLDRILGRILLPASSRLLSVDPERLELMLSRALKVLLAAALPVCVGGIMLADQLLVFLFGPPYLASAPVFRVVLWYFVLSLVHTVYVSAMLAAGNDKEYSRVMVVSGILYLIAVPAYTLLWGIVGAGIAVVAAEAITIVLMRRALANRLRIRIPGSAASILLALVFMAVVLWLLAEYHVLIRVVVGAAAYVVAGLSTGILTLDEWKELRQRLI